MPKKQTCLALLLGVLAVQSLCVFAFYTFSWSVGAVDAAFNANLQALAANGHYTAPNERQEPPKPSAPQLRVRVGQTAPPFSLRDADGRQTQLKDFLGELPVIIEFGSFT